MEDLAATRHCLGQICKACRKAVDARCYKYETPVLDSLATQLLVSEHSVHIQKVFPDILIELLHRCKAQATAEDLACVLARLIRADRNAKQIVHWAEEFFTQRNVDSLLDRFHKSRTDPPPAKKPKRSSVTAKDVEVLNAAFVLLCTDPDLYGGLWDWSCLSQILLRTPATSYETNKENTTLRWIACHCLAIVGRLSPAELENLLRRYLPSEQNISTMRQQEFHASIEDESRIGFDRLNSFGKDRRFTVDVEGVTLSKYQRSGNSVEQRETIMVPTASMRSALRETALAVVSCRPVLITGSVGVGKTLLVEELARQTGNTLVKVQLGNQADSKMLVGSYCCTDFPGKFRWQPGLVTQAVTKGQWLLLEDLDFAPADVVTLLLPLLQERRLPGAGQNGSGLKAAGGFRLFATMRLLGTENDLQGVEGHSEMMGSCQAIEGLLTKVRVGSPSDSELEQILSSRAPALAPFLSKIVHLYRQVQARLREESHCKRLISPRDLVKLAERLSEDFRLYCANPEKLFMDAVDCFIEFVDSPSLKLTLAQSCIGPVFNMGPNEVEHVVEQRKPEILMKEGTLTVGRCCIKKRSLKSIEKLQQSTASSDRFAPTRVSLNVLERITRCVTRREPVLLVGETGTGKTTVVQYLARHTNNKLVVINLNQQTDVVDLIGGFKPVASTYTVLSFINQLRELFSVRKKLLESNRSFLESLRIAYERKAFGRVCTAIAKCCEEMMDAVRVGLVQIGGSWSEKLKDLGYRARAVQTQLTTDSLGNEWLSFAFIEGSLVQAMRRGDWVLLDEINLAETEMLECLATILEHGQLVLQEKGEIDPVKCHPNFRIFACMNPATDVGKKDLPVGIRNRFTELYFEEIIQPSDLQLVAHSYLGGASPIVVGKCVDLYLRLRQLGASKLADGTGHRPHYSLRTLCRAMRFAGQMITDGQQADRAIYEGFCLSFMTQLDPASHSLVQDVIKKTILGHKAGGLLGEQLKKPSSGDFAQFEGYWVSLGDAARAQPEDYILTDTVRKNLKDLARAVSARRHPVLLQGETSVGKTSMITYLAKCTGNTCVRVNNHEHTDITEYVGQYVADEKGALVFKEGVLVEAMRKGHWIILDELNLACSEILEALNRVLDDNRKLFIPESQTEVTAHPKFMLFATQNPPGTYAGRKVLSRAFRNRFIELHFNELPPAELVTILSKRCAVSPKHAAKMVQVMSELQLERKSSGIFAGKQGFITLRDLFRWAERYRKVERTGWYDWDQLLAEEGYMLLAGRVRRSEEELIIRKALKKIFKREIDTDVLWKSSDTTKSVREILDKWESGTSAEEKGDFSHLVWTRNARRLAILVGQAIKFDEPVLLVGETGCGKTTIVQLFSKIHGRSLNAVNCHMHSETADFIGGLRPCRGRTEVSASAPDDGSRMDTEQGSAGKLFEWSDGPLVKAMQNGEFFLADEISLADDSVLERLNSLLETEKTLFLAEKGDGVSLSATEGFWFASTMNPGGDFGKKELSPALRNRFTEIWCPSDLFDDDLLGVIKHNLVENDIIDENTRDWIASGMIKFMRWFEKEDVGKRVVISLRDILSWVNFVNVYAVRLNAETAFVHGASMVLLDSLGTGTTSSELGDRLKTARSKALRMLMSSIPDGEQCLSENQCLSVRVTNKHLAVGPYRLAKSAGAPADSKDFNFSAPTTCGNVMRLLRAMGLQRPLLLEGAPGVGKTSVVTALAKQCGKQVTRINLSEQTDISDLFGADLPVEGGVGGRFEWRDGPLLRALKRGEWILLDELNLASQSVLEGLNACLDHRGEIFVPELNRSFAVERGQTRIFGCQNPHRQGGGRKGLPKSFLNRFTQVYMEALSDEDLFFILRQLFPTLTEDLLKSMVKFNSILCDEVLNLGLWGHEGSPWEFNLRDMQRWAEMIIRYDMHPADVISFVYGDRLRTQGDRLRLADVCRGVFGREMSRPFPKIRFMADHVQMGMFLLPRTSSSGSEPVSGEVADLRLLRGQRRVLESIASCLDQATMCLLVGGSGCGKTSVVRALCALLRRKLTVLPVTSEMDTIELLGGFEQVDLNRSLSEVIDEAIQRATTMVASFLREGRLPEAESVLRGISVLAQEKLPCHQDETNKTSCGSIAAFQRKITLVSKVATEISLPELLPRLQQLKNLATEHGSLTCGGLFTWLDSALVRALQNGEWLLIENVNFCAASVLDRLNGLLEKGGTLTISEAGVKDGELRTIVPHPDFRLILTMDPKNGEISRAMRNRGHEICMLPLDETIDQWDFIGLLEAKGCFNEQIQQKLWAIADELRAQGQSRGIINQMIRVAESLRQELGWGVSTVDALKKSLNHHLKHFSREIDLSALIQANLRDLDDSALCRQRTAAVRNFVYGGNMAEFFEDASVFTLQKADSIPPAVRHVRPALLNQMYLENLCLSDVPAKLTFIDDSNVVEAATALCGEFARKLTDYNGDLCIDHRLNASLSKRLRLRNGWANAFVFGLMDRVLFSLLPVRDEASVGDAVCDTYLGISNRNRDTLPHALVSMLPNLLTTLDQFVAEMRQLKLSNVQVVAAKRLLYGIFRFKCCVNLPVRFVDRDVRMMAVIFLWALKRMRRMPDVDREEQVKALLRQLEHLVPDLFSRARKLRESTVRLVGVPPVLKTRTQAELAEKALSIESLAAKVGERVAIDLADEDEAVVACAVGELDRMTRPMAQRAEELFAKIIQSEVDVPGAEELDEMERRLRSFTDELQRYDGNYVLVAAYDHGQERDQHLQPLSGVVAVRRAMAAVEVGDEDLIVKLTDLAVRSWTCMIGMEAHLRWTAPHIMSTLVTESKVAAAADVPDEKLHSSAIVFNHPAIVQCIAPLVDAETNKANLHLDYSQMKLNELDEIRRLLWQYVTVETDFVDRNQAILQKMVSAVRPVLEQNYSSLTEAMTSALLCLKQADLALNEEPDKLRLNSLLQQVRAAHLLLQIFTPFDTMDPYEKMQLKKAYLQEEMLILRDELEVRRWLQLRRTGCDILDEHPAYSKNTEICEAIQTKLDSVDKRSAYRPEKSRYSELAETMRQYIERNATSKIVDKMLEGILKAEDGIEATLNTWLTNQKSFISQLRRAHPSYRDIIYPFLFGASQLVTCFEALYKFVKCNSLQVNIAEIVQFPRTTAVPLSTTAISAVTSVNTLKKDGQDYSLQKMWAVKFRESKAELLEILDRLRTSSGDRERLLDKVDRIVTWLSAQYAEHAEAEAERELTKESLYEMRTTDFKGEENDEVLEAKAIARLFPNFDEVYEDISDDRDFLNQEKRPDAKPGQAQVEDAATLMKFTEEDLLTIHRIVAEIAAVAGHQERPGPADIVSCVLERFRLFNQLRPDVMDRLDIGTDQQAIASHLVACANTSWVISGDEAKLDAYAKIGNPYRIGQRIDFYRDANIAEVVRCQPVLHQIIRRSKHLLLTFENHHGLVQILKMSYRVLSLPIVSPLMKVLNGLVRVLNEIEEWNKNVPRDMKMSEEMTNLAHLITSWRKLELASWSGLLDSALERRRIEAAKFWLRLEHAVSEDVRTDEQKTESTRQKEVVGAAVALMESTTTVGDFSYKLEMVSQLASYVRNRGRINDKELFRVLSNVHSYYSQFLPVVEDKIRASRQVIDKELKAYLRIVRYKDTSYLAIKQSAEKSHKKLHKYLRDFEKVIQEPASGCLKQATDLETEPATKARRKKKNETEVSLDNYHVKVVDLKVPASDEYSDIPFYHRLSRKYLRQIAEASQVGPIADIMNEVATEIAEDLERLGKETERQIRHNDEQAKRKAKNLLQRKKKSLVQLFRQLTRTGLSYRRGVQLYQKIKAVDLLATPLLDPEETSERVRSFVRDVNSYFVRSVQKYRDLQTAMAVPNKDLELHVVERLQGFGVHLFDQVAKVERELVDLNCLARQLHQRLSKLEVVAASDHIPEQVRNRTRREKMHGLLMKLYSCLQQFLVLMETLPSEEVHSSVKIATNKKLADKTRTTLVENVSVLQEQINLLDGMGTGLLSEKEVSALSETHRLLKGMPIRLSSVIGTFEDGKVNCLTAPYYELVKEVTQIIADIEQEVVDEVDAQQLVRVLDSSMTSCVKKVLHSVQSIVKAYQEKPMLDEDDNTTGILKMLDEEKSKLLDNFDLQGVLKVFDDFQQKVAHLKAGVPSANLASFTAFMQNFSANFEHAFACALKAQRARLKLLYLVLTVSVELAQKGFCIPEQFRDDLLKEGGAELQDIEDGGLGDGEGQKDTSDKIDCEDQLEDTHQKGQEPEEKQDEDQKDIADEENGIEMSEDFDAKAQGPDEKENQDQDQDEEEEDEQNKDELDDQMGDVDDKDPFDLDKEMWDKDQDEDDQDLNSDNEADGGEELEEESQIVAKDDSVKDREKEGKNKDDKPPPGDDEDKEKINEMDDEYEGEKEDPFKSGKEKGLDEDNEVEDFELPENPIETEDVDEEGEDGEGEEADEKEEGEAEGGEDAEVAADEELPELQSDADEPMDQDDPSKTGEDPADAEDQQQEDDQEDKTDASVDKSAVDKDSAEDKPQAEGDCNAAQAAEDASENRGECAQKSDEVDGSGEGQSASTSVEGEGTTADRAREDSVQTEGQSRSREKKSSNERKMAPNTPQDKELIKGNISEAMEREQKSGKEKGNEFEHQRENEADAENEEVAADMATDEQAEKAQPMAANESGEEDEADDSEMKDLAPDETDEQMEVDEQEVKEKLKAIQQQARSKKRETKAPKAEQGQEGEAQRKDGDLVATHSVQRGNQAVVETRTDLLVEKVESIKLAVQSVSRTGFCGNMAECQKIWSNAENAVGPLVQELCEQLRLVLEPTKTSKLKGDYRTGKRLNMRKVIDYVASGFRKDKIWMKRTKPNKRQYQIMLAVDDSASMSDSKAKEMTFETVALLAKALSFLEAGELSVASFGEEVSLVHPLGEPWSSDSGAQLVRNFDFSQTETKLSKLISFATDVFEKSRASITGNLVQKETAQLLIIVSDGRLMSEGSEIVKGTIQRARESGIFIVYLLLDNPSTSQGSVMEMQSASFDAATNKPIIRRYMASFPFPFYVVLRELDSMPVVLGEALRQWFELVTAK